MISHDECNKMIQYIVFGVHHKCTYHADTDMDIRNGDYYCMMCDTMSNSKKNALKGGCPIVKR